VAGAAAALIGAADAAPITWKPTTQSPRAATPDPAKAALLKLCGAPDASLTEVATRSARRKIEGGSLLGSDELAFHLRAAGDPHVWPRAWAVAGPALDDEDLGRRVASWIKPWNTMGVRRCGVVRMTGADGLSVVAAVAVDALADMAPLPTTARVGQWLKLEGTMLVPTREAKVVLLGPRGAPKTVLASLSGNKVRSTFAVDQPGAWLIQVLATVATGPRPVLEAMVFAGSAPPDHFTRAAAPGEDAAKGVKDDDDAMLRMINAARASEKLPPLVRDAALDKLAKAHSEEMIKARMVGHDVGGGDPTARFRAAGLRARVVGENVASAQSPTHAHRALWASPSHRGNLLLSQFDKVGVAVTRSLDGTVWVTEMFSGG